jgi:hypothetical protein
VKQPVRSRKLGLATLLALVVVVLTGTIAAQATTGNAARDVHKGLASRRR